MSEKMQSALTGIENFLGTVVDGLCSLVSAGLECAGRDDIDSLFKAV